MLSQWVQRKLLTPLVEWTVIGAERLAFRQVEVVGRPGADNRPGTG